VVHFIYIFTHCIDDRESAGRVDAKQLKVNVFAVLVDSIAKKVYRKVNIGRLESGPIHGYILGIGGKIQTA
jgi:hypothetical protein